MKKLISILMFFLIISNTWAVSIHQALDKDLIETRWHTASGKSYTIVEAEELTPQIKQKVKSKIFVITYLEESKDKKEVKKNMDNVLAHFYHFILPPQYKTKKDLKTRKSLVTIRGVHEKVVLDKNEYKAHVKTLKLIDVAWRSKYFYRGENHKRFVILNRFYKKSKQAPVKAFSEIKERTVIDYLMMGKIWFETKDAQKSVAILNEGLKKFPKNRDLLQQLVESTFLSGAYILDGGFEYDPEVMKEAKKVAEQVLKIKKDDYLTLANLATIETTLDNFDAAEKIYKDLISKSKNPVVINVRMGELFHFQKKYDEALQFYAVSEKLLGEELRKPSSQNNKELANRIKTLKEKATLKKPL